MAATAAVSLRGKLPYLASLGGANASSTWLSTALAIPAAGLDISPLKATNWLFCRRPFPPVILIFFLCDKPKPESLFPFSHFVSYFWEL